MNWRYVLYGLALSAVLLPFLLCIGLRFGPVPAAPTPPTHAAPMDTRAPAPPNLAFPEPAGADEVVDVVATLPDVEGRIGPSLKEIRGVERWESDLSAVDWDEADLEDTIRVLLDEIGARPADMAEQLVFIHPELAGYAMGMEQTWAYRDRLRGIQVSPAERTRASALARALIARAPSTFQAAEARAILMRMDLVAANAEEREQILWESIVANLRGEANTGLTGYMDRYIVSPEMDLEDHALFASLYPTFPPQYSDLFLRDALRKKEEQWVRFWWTHLRSGGNHPSGKESEYHPLLLENRARLAGAVGAILGEVSNWEDGLRRASVQCAEEETAVALDVQIVFQGGAWQPLGMESGGAFAECIYTAASPVPLDGQRAHLTVILGHAPL